MTNYAAGHAAEKAAAQYLKTKGYKIVSLNWLTRYCEIDVVAEKDKIIYFIEVKYRKSTDYGSGFEYITSQKLKQMTFAAEVWAHQHKLLGQYQLAAIAVTGPEYSEIEFITDIY